MKEAWAGTKLTWPSSRDVWVPTASPDSYGASLGTHGANPQSCSSCTEVLVLIWNLLTATALNLGSESSFVERGVLLYLQCFVQKEDLSVVFLKGWGGQKSIKNTYLRTFFSSFGGMGESRKVTEDKGLARKKPGCVIGEGKGCRRKRRRWCRQAR